MTKLPAGPELPVYDLQSGFDGILRLWTDCRGVQEVPHAAVLE
jgi:hypothetical protein